MPRANDAIALGYRRWVRWCVRIGGTSAALALVIGSAVAAKEASHQLTPLAKTKSPTPLAKTLPSPAVVTPAQFDAEPTSSTAPGASSATRPAASASSSSTTEAANRADLVDTADTAEATRWFRGRPVRPARTIWMTVTAYSPDHRSCGSFADGKTATLHSVWTNGGALVAADTSLLPFGSMLTVPGYDQGRIVPVLDRGGAIKGRRLDVLFPTHREAREWGVREIPVIVWKYADGLPAPNPRRLR